VLDCDRNGLDGERQTRDAGGNRIDENIANDDLTILYHHVWMVREK
jgi:hypothetical protein